jgi:putative transcription factor
MPYCEICGKDRELFRAVIEGTEMNVCQVCSRFGKVIRKIEQPKTEPKQKKPEIIAARKEMAEEIVQALVPDYTARIRKKREELGLKQDELAKKLNEKVSLIHHIESGEFEPNTELARKIEKFLKITLVEQQTLAREAHFKAADNQYTIGDMIKIKKK